LREDLHRALAAEIRGEVRFDPGSRALYATDASNYRQPPIGVIIPRDAEDVDRALDVCRRHDAPVFARGGGTSLAGQCCNAAVCFDFSKYMHRVLQIDAAARIGRVEPGTILDDLRRAAGPHGLTFGPDPATHTHCTLGGMVGNDSCGVHSVMAQFAGNGARTSDNIAELEIITYDGLRMRVGPTSDRELDTIIRDGGRRAEIYSRLKALSDKYAPAIRAGFPGIPRLVSGYNLPALLPENGFNVARALVGSESTCVLVLEIDAKLIPNPAARSLVVLGYPDVYEAGDHVPEILRYQPIGLEGMDDRLIADMTRARIHPGDTKLLPEGGGWLLVEFGGATREESRQRAQQLAEDLRKRGRAPSVKVYDDPAEELKIWAMRESGLGATAHTSAKPTWPGWEDSAVAPERVGEYLRALRALLTAHGYECDLYGHFGQGCVHTRIDFDLQTADGVRRYRAFVAEAADLVASFGGSLSGEHGDGQARGELLGRMFSPELLAAFREFKAIWDPRGRMNPGKVIDADRIDEHLRLGADYGPPAVSTYFHYDKDQGSFAKTMLRCVGVGECRRVDGGTMCPSFMVTREEMHSTRGRARLLFEMLEGDPLTGSWQNEHVKEALDLCLACKGCKSECPVQVDMATYKAEFLAHYFQRHRRPVGAYLFGFVHYWLRLASLVPWAANAVASTPALSAAAKAVAGIPLDRRIPRVAPFTFRDWFRGRSSPDATGRPRVLLWPDTFNNHFHPRTAIAAVRFLERAGFGVEIPHRPLCCGRPLYDYGFLATARRWLSEIVAELAPWIENGTPVIVLEPSCAAVFRDEMPALLHDNPLVDRLRRQTFVLSEFLRANRVAVPALRRKALVHGHCHHKAVLGFDAEREILDEVGLDATILDAGCCGMAGAFGFERAHYDVSIKAGERVLLPAVRQAAPETLIVADGFSCREQIAQLTDRRALHLADVLDLACETGPEGPADTRPELVRVHDERAPAKTAAPALALVAAAAGIGALVWWYRRVKQR
jgi:FAD/FMN-containing dehydrogenase/Fe-S oxidoreductase